MDEGCDEVTTDEKIVYIASIRQKQRWCAVHLSIPRPFIGGTHDQPVCVPIRFLRNRFARVELPSMLALFTATQNAVGSHKESKFHYLE